jgi:hypothetical protein
MFSVWLAHSHRLPPYPPSDSRSFWALSLYNIYSTKNVIKKLLSSAMKRATTTSEKQPHTHTQLCTQHSERETAFEKRACSTVNCTDRSRPGVLLCI